MNFSELQQGQPFETDKVEFKKRINAKDYFSWLKEIDGFANASGGTMYIGVNDESRELEGMTEKEAQSEVEKVQNAMQAHLQPIPVVSFSYLGYWDGGTKKWIVKAFVPESGVKPILMDYQGMRTAFMRRQAKTDPATYEELTHMLTYQASASYDSAFTDEAFHPSDFKKVFQTYEETNDGAKLDDVALANIGFMDAGGKLSRGALFFRDDCQSEATIVHLRAWKGESKGEDFILDNKTILGNLLDLRKAMIGFVQRHSNTGLLKKGTDGERKDDYPELALREAVTNALAHRNYLIAGSEIGLDVFSDRVEILSPGSAYGGKTLIHSRNLLSLFPWRKNQVIASTFSLFHMMDLSRSGVEKLMEIYQDEPEERKPMVDCDAYSFKLTLFAKGRGSAKDPVLDELLRYLEDPHSFEEIAKHLSVSPSSYSRKKYLDPLLKSGRVVRFGQGRKTVYQVS